MAKCTVLQAVSFMHDGAATHYTNRDVGAVVEVDDRQAKALVESGQLGGSVESVEPRHRGRRVEPDEQ